MDFELKTLTFTSICTEKSDALLVFIPQDFNPSTDPLSVMAAGAITAGAGSSIHGQLLSQGLVTLSSNRIGF